MDQKSVRFDSGRFGQAQRASVIAGLKIDKGPMRVRLR